MSDNEERKPVPIVISANPTKTRVWIDKDGNEISGPRGHIIKKQEEESEAS